MSEAQLRRKISSLQTQLGWLRGLLVAPREPKPEPRNPYEEFVDALEELICECKEIDDYRARRKFLRISADHYQHWAEKVGRQRLEFIPDRDPAYVWLCDSDCDVIRLTHSHLTGRYVPWGGGK